MNFRNMTHYTTPQNASWFFNDNKYVEEVARAYGFYLFKATSSTN